MQLRNQIATVFRSGLRESETQHLDGNFRGRGAVDGVAVGDRLTGGDSGGSCNNERMLKVAASCLLRSASTVAAMRPRRWRYFLTPSRSRHPQTIRLNRSPHGHGVSSGLCPTGIEECAGAAMWQSTTARSLASPM